MKTIFTLFIIILGYQSYAQTEISGKITDEKGIAIPGANILV
jgi:hypothetical protein